MQEAYADFEKQVLPIHQQLAAKQAELSALHYGEKPDASKTQSLFREIADLEAKLFTARSAFRSKMQEEGMAGFGPGFGAGRGGYGPYCGFGPGMGGGMGRGGYGHRGGWGGHGGGHGGGWGGYGMGGRW
jgi:hypothetical protein